VAGHERSKQGLSEQRFLRSKLRVEGADGQVGLGHDLGEAHGLDASSRKRRDAAPRSVHGSLRWLFPGRTGSSGTFALEHRNSLRPLPRPRWQYYHNAMSQASLEGGHREQRRRDRYGARRASGKPRQCGSRRPATRSTAPADAEPRQASGASRCRPGRTSDASVEAAVSEVVRSAGRIDLLVNNAGFGVAPAGAEESSIETGPIHLRDELLRVVRMTRAVLPHMRLQGRGRIINIGSVLGFLPMPYGALYAATKHAIEGYSESLDHELRTRGIRVSVIEPAYTRTPFDSNFLQPDAKLDAYREARAGLNERVKELMATAEDRASWPMSC